MKRVISLLMVIALILSLVTIMAFGLTSNGYTYTEENGEACITAYNNTGTDITIPASLGGFPVTKIGDYAFANRVETKGSDITTLNLPNTLKEIGAGAFDINSTMTSLEIPASVERIGNRAFHCWIKLSSVSFQGNRLKSIGKWAFKNCHSLNSLDIPGSVEHIEEGAFSYCTSLSSVAIPESVQSIEREAFLACTSLGEVSFRNRNIGIGDNAFDLTLLDASDATKRALKVYGYKDSSAERFAASENFTFTAFSEGSGEGEEPEQPGDSLSPAGSGPYYVRITYTVTGSNNFNAAYGGYGKEVNDSAGISLLCRAVNGTASRDKEKKWDIGSQMKTTGTYTLTAALEGFPTLLYGYLDDNFAFGSAAFNINKLEVGSSTANYKTVWTGKVLLASKINGYAVSTDWDNIVKRDYFGTDANNLVQDSSGAWEKPYAAKMQADFAEQTLYLDKNAPSAANTFTYSAIDQYGVPLEYSLCKNVSASTSAVADNKNITLTCENGEGTVSCKQDLHLIETDQNEQTISLLFTWKGKDVTKTTAFRFILVDEKYTVTWLGDNESIIANGEDYYGQMPYHTVPEKPADDIFHYSGGRWDKELTALTADVQYKAVYDKAEHIFVFDTSQSRAATCEQDGKNVYVCSECGYQKEEKISALQHHYTASVTEATCTQQGYTTYTCENCHHSYQADFIPVLGHDFSLKDISDAAIRSTGTTEKNGTYYYTCSRCHQIDVRGSYFEVVTSAVCGKVDMSGLYKPVSVTLFKGDEAVESVTLQPGGKGEFEFYELEPAAYHLVLSGENTTFAAFERIDLTGGEKVNLTKSENSEVRLIEVNHGDVNRDGSVDIADVSCMLRADVYATDSEIEDINGDGIVDIHDIAITLLAANYASTSKHLSV